MKVHHIGYAVKDMEKSVAAFAQLGYEPISPVTDDAGRGVTIAFLRNGHETVELIAPNKGTSAVDGILKKNGASPYHICYEVGQLPGAVSELEHMGYIVLIGPQAAPALANRRVAFLLHRDVGMVELVEA